MSYLNHQRNIYSQTISGTRRRDERALSSDTEDELPDCIIPKSKSHTTHGHWGEEKLANEGSGSQSLRTQTSHEQVTSSTNYSIKLHDTGSESRLILILETSSNDLTAELAKCTSILLFNSNDHFYNWMQVMNVNSKELRHIVVARAEKMNRLQLSNVCIFNDANQEDFTEMLEKCEEADSYTVCDDFGKFTRGTISDTNTLLRMEGPTSLASIADETDRELNLWTFTGPLEWDPEWDEWFDLEAASNFVDSIKIID